MFGQFADLRGEGSFARKTWFDTPHYDPYQEIKKI